MASKKVSPAGLAALALLRSAGGSMHEAAFMGAHGVKVFDRAVAFFDDSHVSSVEEEDLFPAEVAS